jgi:hypothetical protein
MLEVIADTRIHRKVLGECPVILDKTRVFGRCEISAGISERLPILIGLAPEKGIEGRKDVDCPKTVIS